MGKTTFTVKDDKKTLVAERVFDAPQDKVWDAFTQPQILEQWWGPRGWSTDVKHMDFTPGGYLLYGMTCNDPAQTDWYGKTNWSKSSYSAIEPKNSFSYTDTFCDENGQVLPNMPTMDITVTITTEGDATKVTSTSVFASEEALKQVIEMGVEAGLDQTWDRLEETVTNRN